MIEFKPIDGFPGYEVSSDGRLWSYWVPGHRKQGTIRRSVGYTQRGRTTYRVAWLCRGGIYNRRGIHVLVCEAFHGPRPGHPRKWHASHINGNPLDNRAVNLRWATAKENQADRDRHGTSCRGGQNPNSLLTEQDVRMIRQTKQTTKALAIAFGVSYQAIWNIRKGRSWTHVK